MSADNTIQALIEGANSGDRAARSHLFETLYSELRRLAHRELGRNNASLSATTLLHEVYLNLSEREGLTFPDRGRFMAYAARAMRGLIVDFARNRQAQKRGGGFEFTSLGNEAGGPGTPQEDLAQVSEALDELAAVEPVLAEVVDLKFFCGLSTDDIAALRGVSSRTVERDWQKARIYLHNVLKE